MNATQLIQKIEAAGFQIEAEGNGIAITPASRLTDPQRAFIRAHRPELIAALTGKPAANNPTQADPAPTYDLDAPPLPRRRWMVTHEDGRRFEYSTSEDREGVLKLAREIDGPVASIEEEPGNPTGARWRTDRHGCASFKNKPESGNFP